MKDDLISRQAAIRWVKTECNPYGKPTLEFESGKKVIEHLEQMPTAQSNQRWIPVTEKLPEEGKNVLVSVHFLGLEQKHKNGWNDHIKENWYVDIASHFDGEWTSYSDEYKVAQNRHKVVAWRELPEPWKGENDG